MIFGGNFFGLGAAFRLILFYLSLLCVSCVSSPFPSNFISKVDGSSKLHQVNSFSLKKNSSYQACSFINPLSVKRDFGVLMVLEPAGSEDDTNFQAGLITLSNSDCTTLASHSSNSSLHLTQNRSSIPLFLLHHSWKSYLS